MELTSKQRAQLRGLANGLDAIVHIGKDGMGDNLIKQANDALEARELIKCRVLENAEYTAREAADALARVTRADVVQVIGTKFVLYRPTHRKDKKDKIVLVRSDGKRPRPEPETIAVKVLPNRPNQQKERKEKILAAKKALSRPTYRQGNRAQGNRPQEGQGSSGQGGFGKSTSGGTYRQGKPAAGAAGGRTNHGGKAFSVKRVQKKREQ